jgi:tRNA-splicing ligase RtcB
MPNPVAPNVKAWLVEPLSPELRRSIRRIASAEDVRQMAIMPDVHLAGDVCIGSVIATTRLIYPAAVGGDIGCGIAAAAFDLPAEALRDASRANALFEQLRELVPPIRRTRDALQQMSSELCSAALSDERLDSIRRRDGILQFGTLGRGNHFLEFQTDDEGRLWLMVHSGSRAMGQAIRDFHVERAAGVSRGMRFIECDSPQGVAYLSDADWARRYACGNRRAMVELAATAIRRLFNGALDEAIYFDCDHNHVQRETHGGQLVWIHRKGANSAAVGEPGIIPGSMGTESFHVAGRGNPHSLCSSSHGAGRAMSRGEARRTISESELRSQLGETFFLDSDLSGLREEAPSAYKDVREVLRAQKDLVKRVRRLVPVLSYKG